MDVHFDPPLVAIMRGLTPGEAPAVGATLFAAGFRLLEVPLNRPGALEAIAALVAIAPPDAVVGGGTILSVADVEAVHAAGGCMMVAPNCNPAVIRRAAELGMLCAPGIATPTEAFQALDAGAHALKIFPAEMVGQAGLKAINTVLPPGTPVWPVGGITPESLGAWVNAGATGFGIGSQLFGPRVTSAEVGERARRYVDAWKSARG
ncbi:MAG: 2-dehydro-3-deoxy-6-phosphogalactonate aldolase [Gammaproteobacteria bacterium]